MKSRKACSDTLGSVSSIGLDHVPRLPDPGYGSIGICGVGVVPIITFIGSTRIDEC